MASTGGEFKGKSHAQGGIPVTLPGGKKIEVEGDELIMNKKSSQAKDEYVVKGTPKQIVSALNQIGGGVHIESGATLKDMKTGKVMKMKRGGQVKGEKSFADYYTKNGALIFGNFF